MSHAIDYDKICNQGHTLHNKRDPISVKAQFFHDSFDEASLNPVKRLAHTKLDRHKAILTLRFVIEIMQEFNATNVSTSNWKGKKFQYKYKSSILIWLMLGNKW